MTMLRLERQGPLAVLTLDRPPASALNRDFFAEVGTVLPPRGRGREPHRAHRDPGRRAVSDVGAGGRPLLVCRTVPRRAALSRPHLFTRRLSHASVGGRGRARGRAPAPGARARRRARGERARLLRREQASPAGRKPGADRGCSRRRRGPGLGRVAGAGDARGDRGLRGARDRGAGAPVSDAPLAEQLADEVAAIGRAELPPAVLARARDLLRDYLGVTLGGAVEESSVVLRRGLGTLGAAGDATVLGTTERLSAPHAALANGAAAHALEMDDTHQGGSIHLGATIFSAALAAAELAGAGGRRVLHAAVAGYEVAARLAMALDPAAHYR